MLKTINDPFFGKLKPNRSSSQKYWYGDTVFSPTGNQIKIYFYDLENGVSEEHKRFYLEFENKYSEIKDHIAEYLHKAYNISNGSLLLEDVWSKFVLVAIIIPRYEGFKNAFFEWDLYFSYDVNKPNFLIEMENWKPIECYSGE